MSIAAMPKIRSLFVLVESSADSGSWLTVTTFALAFTGAAIGAADAIGATDGMGALRFIVA